MRTANAPSVVRVCSLLLAFRLSIISSHGVQPDTRQGRLITCCRVRGKLREKSKQHRLSLSRTARSRAAGNTIKVIRWLNYVGVRTCAHTSMECVHVHWCIQLHLGALPAPASPTTNLTAAIYTSVCTWLGACPALLCWAPPLVVLPDLIGFTWMHINACFLIFIHHNYIHIIFILIYECTMLCI